MHNRKHGRVRAKGVASHLRDGGQLITGLSVENLSRGGAFVRCATPMPIGTAVVLDLVRPGLKRMLQMTGRVVSIVDHESANARNAVAGMGIQFDPYSSAVGERLTEMLVALGAGASVLDADPPAPAPALEPSPAFNFSESVSVPDNTRLMVQVKGLLMELGDWQQKAAELERENTRLRAENERLRAWVEANK
jgi:Tfp pilus assembly protein PilZ